MTPRRSNSVSLFHQVAENIWEINRPLQSPGLRLEHRMTVIRLGDGGLWVHSPVECESALLHALVELGSVRHFVAPNRFHDLYWPGWFARYPDAVFHCVPGMAEEHRELPFQNVLRTGLPDDWNGDFSMCVIGGMPKLNEVVFLHRESRTLIVADLVFNLQASQQGPLGKLFLKLNGVYNRVGCSRVFRSMIQDRAAFRVAIQTILAWPFERVIPGHGQVIENGGKAMLERAFDWLDA